MRRLFFLVGLLVFLTAASGFAAEYNVTYTRVVDGDTFVVQHENGAIDKVRIIGLDTPELHHPRKPVEFFAKEAKEKAVSLVLNKKLVLRTDPTNAARNHRGRYGRLLVNVYLPGNRDFALVMIREGYAHAYVKYPFTAERMNRYRQAERKARREERGLWGSTP
ncbi:MAG: thermonuclease family protein [Candidatus Lernaella stagnicola]|nr:thermonuclease family protein [Candidatus Lernaella stagnicola]